MTALETTLLIAGLIFPAISLLTGVGSLLHRWRTKKYSSPVFVPFVGPILLTCWVMVDHRPFWLIAVVWVADIGTLMFLAVSPRLVADWWRTSCFTKILTLRGSKGIQSAVITLHSSGHYLLKKSWNRPPGEIGILGLGEPGTYVCKDDNYELTAHHGLHRTLRKIDETTYRVEEDSPIKEELRNYTLNEWLLKT